MAARPCPSLLLCVALAGPAAQSAPSPSPLIPGALVDEIDGIVGENFYSPARLQQVNWRAAVVRAREELADAHAAAERVAVVRKLVASLATSHTAFYPRADPAYWDMASLFEPVLERVCPKELTPGFPIARDGIGVFWKQVAADCGPPIPVLVTPRSTRPQEELRRATAESFRVIEHRGLRIAYIHVWSWATLEFQKVVLDAIAKSNAAAADRFILDLRDGWGGAHGNYLGIFWRDVPLLESVARDGKTQPFDQQIRRPAVLLVNGGTRSGKETIAYGAKKHRLARLVGERTAGAYTFGRPFCLSDGSLSLLAVSDARVDGERLEGRGVAPDLEVPFDFRYAAGTDAQLERALDVLSKAGKLRNRAR